MLKIILAALLVAAPVPSKSPSPKVIPITQTEILQRAHSCSDLVNKKVTSAEVIKQYQLNTAREQRDFALQCEMFVTGFILGQQSTSTITTTYVK